jgi:hypothetical protein
MDGIGHARPLRLFPVIVPARRVVELIVNDDGINAVAGCGYRLMVSLEVFGVE